MAYLAPPPQKKNFLPVFYPNTFMVKRMESGFRCEQQVLNITGEDQLVIPVWLMAKQGFYIHFCCSFQVLSFRFPHEPNPLF